MSECAYLPIVARGDMTPMLKRVVLVAGIAAILGALYSSGFFDLISDADLARAALEELGIWAPILYVVAFAMLEPFFIPGLAFMIPGAVVFSFPELFVLSWLGSIGAGIVGFSFARFVGREFVENRLPDRLRRYDEQLATHGLRTVILVRVMLFLAPPAHWLLGLSQVRFAPFVLGTAIGFVPGIGLAAYLIVFVGESLGEWISSLPRGSIAAVIIGLVVANRIRLQIAKRRKNSEPDSGSEPANQHPEREEDLSAR
jgi:uncharacterized membrane protein YdjX (TVP38/TMEM64 family)